jgi:hypothetical protein
VIIPGGYWGAAEPSRGLRIRPPARSNQPPRVHLAGRPRTPCTYRIDELADRGGATTWIGPQRRNRRRRSGALARAARSGCSGPLLVENASAGQERGQPRHGPRVGDAQNRPGALQPVGCPIGGSAGGTAT